MDLWIFDNDGTLYDDSETHKNFMEIFSEYSSKLLGVPIQEVSAQLVKLKNKWNTGFPVIALMKEFGIDYSEIVDNTYLKINLEKCNVPKYDHVRKKALDNILADKVVFTNNPSVFARRVLLRLGLDRCFSDFVGMEEACFFGKPDIRAFKALEFRHQGYTRIIFCDDSLKNLEVAHQIGWITVWYRPLIVDVKTGGKHLVVNSFNGIERLL